MDKEVVVSRGAILQSGLPTIAFLAAPLDASLYYQKWLVWAGIARAARMASVNLLYIAGGEARPNAPAILYDLLDTGAVHAIISWNGVVTPWPADLAQAFLARYRPRPIVNLGAPIPGIASVVFDQAAGVAAAARHLIEVHARRRIAFLNPMPSHPGLAAGFEGYVAALSEYNAFDPALVAPAPTGDPLAALDTEGLHPGRDYDAILCPLDSLAITVIGELQSRNIHVPEDVAVIGVHDGQEARLVTPALTTVRLPWEEAGARATEMLLTMLSGQEAVADMRLPCPLIVRRSCGCLDARTQRAALPIGVLCPEKWEAASAPTDIWKLSAGERQKIIEAMQRAVGRAASDAAPGWAERLLNAVLADLGTLPNEQAAPRPPQTLAVLEEQLRRSATASGSVAGWHDVLSALRGGLIPALAGHASSADAPELLTAAENIFQQARLAVAQAVTRQEAQRAWATMACAQTLQELESALHVAATETDIFDTLTRFLSRLGIRDCYVGLYEDPTCPTAGLRWVFGYQGGQRYPVNGSVSTSARLPTAMMLGAQGHDATPTCLTVQALYFGEQHLGVLICSAEPAQGLGIGTAYETLRSHLSSALIGMRLRCELEAARQQADEANQLKSRFLAMVSHELRNPLAQIVSLTELANLEMRGRHHSPGALAKKLTGYHAQIHASAQHLDRLIRDVIDLAREQVGQLRLDIQPLDLRDLLAEIAETGQRMAAERRLGWRCELPADPLPVLGDRTRLQQVLLNLLANAVKFTPRGEVVLRSQVQGGRVVVEVSDTGIGIPPEDQAAIFNEFRQAPGAIARGLGGLGLGLAVTRRLVERHGGEISVESTGIEGQGATFRFSLPLALQPVPTQALTRRADGAAAPVLIVGPSGDRRRAVVERLTDDGFEVVTATPEPDEGLPALVRRYMPGAIIIEYAPESEWGWESLLALRDDPLTRNIPVIFYALLAPNDCGDVLALDILTKPLSTAQLDAAWARLWPEKTVARGAPTILIVDDDLETLSSHEALVRASLPGSTVLTAAGGQAALAIIKERVPDLMLLDLVMPDVDGFQVLTALRADPRTRHMPVVVLTGQALTESEMARLTRGVAVVLSKGVLTQEETIGRISAILARAPQLGTEGQRQVRRALAYIHAHYAEPISRRAIAAHLGLHEDVLSHYFKEEMGVNFVTYLNRYRLKQACKLLEGTSQSITAVAAEVGFENLSYFTRIFAREMGMTPTEYRQGRRRL